MASAVHVDLITQPPGVTPIDIVTTRLDGVNMRFTAALGGMTLGNLPPETSRYATWYFRPTTPGPKTFLIRASSENGGEIILTKTVQVDSVMNLVQTAMGTSPSAPLLAAGAAFSVTDTVQNTGTGPSASSTTRYYLSPDATKSADDTLLSGTHSVPSLDRWREPYRNGHGDDPSRRPRPTATSSSPVPTTRARSSRATRATTASSRRAPS